MYLSLCGSLLISVAGPHLWSRLVTFAYSAAIVRPAPGNMGEHVWSSFARVE